MQAIVELARPEDDAGIRALLQRQAMPGRVRMAYCREPAFSIGCGVTGTDVRVIVARSEEDGEIVGVACRSIRRVFLDGQEQRIGYLGHLRVDDRYRGRWLVSRGFSMIRRMDRDDPLPVYLASIVDGNAEATEVLVNKSRRSFPMFREAATYCTLAIRTRRERPRLSGPEALGPASPDQLAELVRFLRSEGARYQLATAWSGAALEELDGLGLTLDDIVIARLGGRIVGAAALWDQTAYKQSVVRGYEGWLKLAAPVLPRAGAHIRSAYASLLSVDRDDPLLFARLLRELHNRASARRFDYLLVGLDARDPLLMVARAYPHLRYPSRLYLGSWIEGDTTYDASDHRLARVDIATL
jgi:hypothetical protein